MQIFKQQIQQTKVGFFDFVPSCIEHQVNAPAKLISKNITITSTCIHCNNPRCMYFEKEEIQCDEIEDFASEPTNNVCPVEAIKMGDDGKAVIDVDKCIY